MSARPSRTTSAGRGCRRRAFLAGMGVAPWVCWFPRRGSAAPSNRIQLGMIGVGWHGFEVNLKSFLQESDCRVVAVCDVRERHVRRAVEEIRKAYGPTDVRTYRDFRELLADPGVDAVCISTPDHWHVTMSIAAARAGKDVFCEKPTWTIAEGRQLVKAMEETGRVFQFGLEDRSLIHYHKLAEWVRNGEIGELRRIEVGLPAGRVVPKEPPEEPPADLDYDLWVGPAPWAPYSKSRTEPMVWRQIRDYSGGMITDWGAHLVDTAQVAAGMERSGPVEIEGEGEIPTDAMTTTPVTFTVRYRYPNGVEMTVRSTGPSIRLEGTRGWIACMGWRGQITAEPAEILQRRYAPGESRFGPRPPTEHRNFLDCVRSRAATTYPAEDAHRLSTTLHLGVLAIELRRRLRWNPDTESFVGDTEADRLRTRPVRDDWQKHRTS